MKNSVVVIVILLLAVVAGILTFHTFSNRKAGMHDDMNGNACYCGKSNHLSSEIGLSKKQQAKIEPLDAEFNAKIQAICKILCEKRVGLSQILANNKDFNKDVEAGVENITRLQAEIEKETARHILDVKKVLDSKQAEKFRSMLSDKLCGEMNK